MVELVEHVREHLGALAQDGGDALRIGLALPGGSERLGIAEYLHEVTAES